MLDSLKIIAPPMHPEGRKFVGIFAAISVLLGLLWEPLFWLGLGLTVWCFYFFRDPQRAVPQKPGLLVSPADGKICLLSEVDPPAELGLEPGKRWRVSVFMNVFNCHVNRTPAEGLVRKIHYSPGRFVNASLDKASEHNERNALVVEMEDGRAIGVVQIAGLVARRILCEVQEREHLNRGERFGLIRFGSRVDVYLPQGCKPQVALGQTMVAGETIICDLTAKADDFNAEMI